MTIMWIIWSDARSPVELDRCRAGTKGEAEAIAAERFPGVRLLVQSALSARQAAREPSPAADSKRALDRSNIRRGMKRAAARKPCQTLPSENV